MVAHGAAAALRTRPLPQPTASSLVVEIFFFSASTAITLEQPGHKSNIPGYARYRSLTETTKPNVVYTAL